MHINYNDLFVTIIQILYWFVYFLSYRTEISEFEKFREKFKGYHISFRQILDAILSYFPNKNYSSKPLIIINIDDTNSIFEQNIDIFLKQVIRLLSYTIIEQSYFVFPILTGTHASDLFDTVKSTNVKFEEIHLPLLKTSHAKEVILELANRGQVS